MTGDGIFGGGDIAPVSREDAIARLIQQLGLGDSLSRDIRSEARVAPSLVPERSGSERTPPTPHKVVGSTDPDAPLGGKTMIEEAGVGLLSAAIPGGAILSGISNLGEEGRVSKALGTESGGVVDFVRSVFGAGPNVAARDDVGLLNRDMLTAAGTSPPAGGVVTRAQDRMGSPRGEEDVSKLVSAVFAPGSAGGVREARGGRSDSPAAGGGQTTGKGTAGGVRASRGGGGSKSSGGAPDRGDGPSGAK